MITVLFGETGARPVRARRRKVFENVILLTRRRRRGQAIGVI